MKFIINLLILFVLIINSSYADDELITLEELRSLDSKIDNIEVSEIYKDILEVYSLNNLQGYAFLTSSFSDALGFSSAEFNILIYLSKNGEILAAKLLSHSEPLFLYDKGEVRYEGKGINEDVLYKFILQYKNKSISNLSINSKNKDHNIDGVSSATITSILMHQSIIVSVNKILNIIGLNNNQSATLDHNSFTPVKWNEMLKDGSISNNKSYYSENNKTINNNNSNKLFLDVYFAYANPVGIGQNNFGNTEY